MHLILITVPTETFCSLKRSKLPTECSLVLSADRLGLGGAKQSFLLVIARIDCAKNEKRSW